jgi:hypothetical protein
VPGKLDRVLHLVNPLMHGADIRAAQELLVEHMYLAGRDVDGQYGPQTAEAARQAKWDLGYPAKNVVPTYGPILYSYLDGKSVPAAYTKRAKERAKQPDTEAAKRGKLVEYGLWGIANEPLIHYAQERPMEMGNLKQLPTNMDCSEFVTKAYAYAKAPDPNGENYNGSGYTGTILAHCKPITRAMLKAGDPIVFGPGTGHHVVMALEAGPDPWCVSHGQEKGPQRIRLSDEASYQPAPVTCLTLPSWS